MNNTINLFSKKEPGKKSTPQTAGATPKPYSKKKLSHKNLGRIQKNGISPNNSTSAP